MAISAWPDQRPAPAAARAPVAPAASSPALIFRVEDVFVQLNLDYGPLLPPLAAGRGAGEDPFPVLESLRARVPAKEYDAMMTDFEAAAKTMEAEALRSQDVPAPTAKAVRSLRSGTFKLAAYSSLDDSVIRSFLTRSGLLLDIDFLWARTSQNGDLVKRLGQGFVANRVDGRRSVFFSGRPGDVKIVKGMGLRAVLLPNRYQKGMMQMLAKPDAYIITLGEAAAMMELPAWAGGAP